MISAFEDIISDINSDIFLSIYMSIFILSSFPLLFRFLKLLFQVRNERIEEERKQKEINKKE